MDPSESNKDTTVPTEPPKQRKRKSGWDTPAPAVAPTATSIAEQGLCYDYIKLVQFFILFYFLF